MSSPRYLDQETSANRNRLTVLFDMYPHISTYFRKDIFKVSAGHASNSTAYSRWVPQSPTCHTMRFTDSDIPLCRGTFVIIVSTNFLTVSDDWLILIPDVVDVLTCNTDIIEIISSMKSEGVVSRYSSTWDGIRHHLQKLDITCRIKSFQILD